MLDMLHEHFHKIYNNNIAFFPKQVGILSYIYNKESSSGAGVGEWFDAQTKKLFE